MTKPKGTYAPRGVFPGENQFKPNIRYVGTGEYRNPLKGEYFLSGSVVTAYLAPNDLSTPYWIAKPVEMKQCHCCKGTGKVMSA